MSDQNKKMMARNLSLPIAAIWLSAMILSTSVSRADEKAPTGKVIFDFSTDKNAVGHEFLAFQIRTTDRKKRDSFSYSTGGFFNTGDDFQDDREKGAVKIMTLPVGDWEIYDYSADNTRRSISPKRDLSIPFSVKAGQTTYIGGYRVVWLTGTSIIGMDVADGAYFIVSDKGERDIPIAKRKDNLITEVTTTLPMLTSPYFVAEKDANPNVTLPVPKNCTSFAEAFMPDLCGSPK